MIVTIDQLRCVIGEWTSTDTKFFGKDPDEFRQEGGLIDLNKMQEAGYQLLGKGQFRTTLSVPSNNDVVIKVVHTLDAAYMNQQEASGWFQTSYQDFIPKVYTGASDYAWIVVEKVNPVANTTELGEVILDTFSSIESIVKNHRAATTPERMRTIAANLFKKCVTSMSNIRIASDMYMSARDVERARDTFINFTNMVREFNIDEHEIQEKNLGYRNTSGKKSLILLDGSVL